MKHLRPLWYTKRLQCEQKKSIYTGLLFSTLLELNYIFCFFFLQTKQWHVILYEIPQPVLIKPN